MHIRLDHFSYKKCRELQYSLNQLLVASGVRARDVRAMRRAKTTTGADFPSILSDIWSWVVKPVLNCLALTVSNFLSKPPKNC